MNFDRRTYNYNWTNAYWTIFKKGFWSTFESYFNVNGSCGEEIAPSCIHPCLSYNYSGPVTFARHTLLSSYAHDNIRFTSRHRVSANETTKSLLTLWAKFSSPYTGPRKCVSRNNVRDIIAQFGGGKGDGRGG